MVNDKRNERMKRKKEVSPWNEKRGKKQYEKKNKENEFDYIKKKENKNQGKEKRRKIK